MNGIESGGEAEGLSDGDGIERSETALMTKALSFERWGESGGVRK